jgi:hypothetical protein
MKKEMFEFRKMARSFQRKVNEILVLKGKVERGEYITPKKRVRTEE